MKINPTKVVHELLTALVYIIDVEKGVEIFHGWRVAALAASFSDNNVGVQEKRNVFYAGLLHDIGGTGFPYHIVHFLKRKDKISKNILLSHPLIGAQLVSNLPQMTREAGLIVDHHEWINGQGYPQAKLAQEIPLGSQIIRLADSVDIAMRTNHLKDTKGLKNKLLPFAGKEYARDLFFSALTRLNKDRLFLKIKEPADIPSVFHEIRESIGPIRIQTKIDAIGKTLEVIAQVIDMKHTYTSGHSFRVARYAMAIGSAMNLDHDQITLIKWAGLIHDIGKYGVPQHILNKPKSLTPKEFREIRRHAQITRRVMEMIPSLKNVTPIASGHHECFDGSGYPLGLKREKIPLGARILVVCDAFDAMTSNRPYRQPLAPKTACSEIKRLSGKQFDPEIVKKALPLFRNLLI